MLLALFAAIAAAAALDSAASCFDRFAFDRNILFGSVALFLFLVAALDRTGFSTGLLDCCVVTAATLGADEKAEYGRVVGLTVGVG